MSQTLIAKEIAEISEAVKKSLSTVLHEGEEYDAYLCLERIPALERHAQQTLLEIGRLFRALQIERGSEFSAFVSAAGYTPRYAQRMAALYERLRIGDRKALAKLGPSKVLELMQESDEALDELSKGKKIAGAALDDIDAMSVRELREHLRKARDQSALQRETQDKLVAKRDAKIQKLQKALDLGEQYPAAERAADICADIARAAATLVASAREALDRVVQMVALNNESDIPEQVIDMARGHLQAAVAAALDLDGALG